MRSIYINNVLTELPVNIITVEDLVKWKGLPMPTTAIALNDKFLPKDRWDITSLEDMQRITIISAAFGG